MQVGKGSRSVGQPHRIPFFPPTAKGAFPALRLLKLAQLMMLKRKWEAFQHLGGLARIRNNTCTPVWSYKEEVIR